MRITKREKIRQGQLWRKRDTGVVVEITSTRKNTVAMTRNINGSKHTHGIPFNTLWLWWEKI